MLEIKKSGRVPVLKKGLIMKYTVIVPIVGYTYVNVEAGNEAEAKEKALDICCDFKNENVEVAELYGLEKVVEGNTCSHPQWEIEVEEETEENE